MSYGLGEDKEERRGLLLSREGCRTTKVAPLVRWFWLSFGGEVSTILYNANFGLWTSSNKWGVAIPIYIITRRGGNMSRKEELEQFQKEIEELKQALDGCRIRSLAIILLSAMLILLALIFITS